MFDVTGWDFTKHVLVQREGAGSVGVALGEVLRDGKSKPVAAVSGLSAEDGSANFNVLVVASKVNRQGGEVCQEIERVLSFRFRSVRRCSLETPRLSTLTFSIAQAFL